MLLDTMKQKDVTKLTNENLIRKHDELKAIIAEAEALLKQVDDELFARTNKIENKKLIVGDRTVSIVKRVSYKDVTLNFARRHEAIKEVVDTAILGGFYKSGMDIPGLTFTEYPLVSK